MDSLNQESPDLSGERQNGENFIRETIDSLLNQTFKDFELIISDNASTDATEAICRDYVAKDQRVRYYRNSENLGASANYTRVFELASGEYFKWAAHDDICLPDFLNKCVEILDRDPSVVLAYSLSAKIDHLGNLLHEFSSTPELASANPVSRFRAALSLTYPGIVIWGVIRKEILQKTPLLGNYPGHDRPLLTRLSLYGRFHEIPEVLFLLREHPQRSIHVYNYRKPHEAVVWYDPQKAGKLIFPTWRLLAEYLAAIYQVPLSWHQRLSCSWEIVNWLKDKRKHLLLDLTVATERIPVIGSQIENYSHKIQSEIEGSLNWAKEANSLTKQIEPIIASKQSFILVDEANFESSFFTQWRVFPFLEREGQYWGLPPDDDTAIRELQRLRQEGAEFIVFVWLTFWWFDYYSQFHNYLRSKFPCVLENDRIVAFDLQKV